MVNSLSGILTPTQLKKVKKILMDGIVNEKYYLRQWFIMIDIDYKELKKEIEQYAVEHNCNVTDITYGKYPDHIEW